MGTIGDIGCFSLGMISLISSGYGGFVVTKNKALYEKMKLMRDHGLERGKIENYKTMGFNFKVSDLLISLAVSQLKRVDKKIEHLRYVSEVYREGLAGNKHVKFMEIEDNSIPLCVDLMADDRTGLIKFLASNGVECSEFHKPLSEIDYFQRFNKHRLFPNSLAYANHGFMPPCGPSQSIENVENVVSLINSWKP